eukprot:CAMPEP_0196583180 /NCGR_PEP_ID=MMETSP1081-20130531/42436_1 /TAXON_ID=36882 /ORGANISM="Pyramimonas amylifera, Strain CCMP720" /LENGTH=366 /DNA_ID=CAMNT_0041903991 /DNA_START=285 /DNA_END=1385 /DNA_ORIENTATION=-
MQLAGNTEVREASNITEILSLEHEVANQTQSQKSQDERQRKQTETKRQSSAEPKQPGANKEQAQPSQTQFAIQASKETIKNSKVRTRVAVCVSGQTRTLMMLPSDPSYPTDWRPTAKLPKPTEVIPSGPPIAGAIQKNVFSQLGIFDVFMRVGTTESSAREPKVGDTTACELLRPSPASGGQLVCVVEKEYQQSLDAKPQIWQSHKYKRKGTLLYQLFGMFRCNQMRKQFTARTGITHTHIVRLRPDTFFPTPIPPISKLNFGMLGSSSVVIASDEGCDMARYEDQFGIGETNIMDMYLDRIFGAMLQRADDWYSRWSAYDPGGEWKAETMLIHYMTWVVNATLVKHDSIMMCLMRPKDRRANGSA